jgi:hypothetical protein
MTSVRYRTEHICHFLYTLPHAKSSASTPHITSALRLALQPAVQAMVVIIRRTRHTMQLSHQGKFERCSSCLAWFMALLFSILAAGCDGGGGRSIAVIAPTVTATAPRATTPIATGVAINSKLVAFFSRDMTPASISASSFTLACPADTAIRGTVSYIAASRAALFSPAVNLPANTTCSATITTNANDSKGNRLVRNFTWSFKTGATTDVTRATVTATLNANGATNVAINSKVAATFSEAMDPSTITSATFILKLGDTVIPGNVTYSGFSAVFTPSSNLAPATTYTPTITSGAKDLAGNALASNYAWVWTTAAAHDTTIPTVIGTIHTNGATNVTINTKVGATFSEAMDPLTITNANFTLENSEDGAAVEGTVGYSGVNALFIPLNNLEPYARYTITVKGGADGVTDLAGNPMTSDFVISWTTGAVPDATPPNVTLTAPTNAATGVLINSKVTATFSKEMDPLTITNLIFTVAGVPGAVTSDPLTRMATFTPASNFAAGTSYTATISTEAQDLAGNAMAANYSWSFTTLARNYVAWSDQGIVYTDPARSAYYPNVVYNVNGFGGAANYAMWYSDGSGAAFRVTSLNGTTWGAPTTMSGLGGRAHHVQILYNANHFGLGPSGPSYRMWYWDIGASLYDISSMATAQSTDGVNWINNTALTQDASAQLVTGAGTGWNRGSYGPVSLIYQPSAANSGTNPWSYSYVMYYDGTDGSREETGLAYSTDGVFWKAYVGNPTLSISASPAWDSNDSAYGTVYRDAYGFHYWYSGGVSSPNEGIGYAFSSDGKTWTKNSTPIFQIGDGAAYRNSRTYTPSIIDDGSGTLKMYYTAVGADGVKKIGLATLPP